MTKSIKSILDEECAHLKVGNPLLKSIRIYGQNFVNKNPDHVAFFGSPLLGVYPVRFKTSDKDIWFDDILEADDITIRNRVIELDTVAESWVRGTDAMNLSCLWLSHKIFNSELPDKTRRQGMIDVLTVLHYKLLSSLMAHNFPYPADKDTAMATHASLNRKFAIKRCGSWGKLIEERCKDIIDVKSPHYRTIQLFDDDADIQSMITDIQGRLRSIVKNLWREFDKVRQQELRVITSRGTVELDGEAILKDMTRNYNQYRRYIHDVAQDKKRFIKPELVDLIDSSMKTMPKKLLEETLEYMVDMYGKRGDKNIENFIDETLLHAFEYFSRDSGSFTHRNDAASIIMRLRAIYMSSRSKDPSLITLRDLGAKVVTKAITSRNVSVIASVRTGAMLYLVIRAFSKDHYK